LSSVVGSPIGRSSFANSTVSFRLVVYLNERHPRFSGLWLAPRTRKWESGLLDGKEHMAGLYTFATDSGPGELFPSGLLGPVRSVQVF
jgi:hypothetical protein